MLSDRVLGDHVIPVIWLDSHYRTLEVRNGLNSFEGPQQHDDVPVLGRVLLCSRGEHVQDQANRNAPQPLQTDLARGPPDQHSRRDAGIFRHAEDLFRYNSANRAVSPDLLYPLHRGRLIRLHARRALPYRGDAAGRGHPLHYAWPLAVGRSDRVDNLLWHDGHALLQAAERRGHDVPPEHAEAADLPQLTGRILLWRLREGLLSVAVADGKRSENAAGRAVK